MRADYLHNFGTHFIIGRTIGQVFNPVVGGPDLVKNLESSVKTKYDGLLLSVEKRFSRGFQFRASYTLSKAFNYANDDQIPFSNGPVDSDNLQLEYGPDAQRPAPPLHLRGRPRRAARLPPRAALDARLGRADGHPPARRLRAHPLFAAQRGRAPLPHGRGAERLPRAAQRRRAASAANRSRSSRTDARFSDSFNSFDLRVTRPFRFGERVRLEPIVEVFNLFNVTNVLGVSNVNYSGFSNVLVRDSNDSAAAGFLRSSSFGRPVTTAGGVFGSGGPRAFQLAARLTF